VALRPNAGHGLLILEVSRSHTTTHQLVGLLWTSDQLVAETSTWQHTTLTTHKHPCRQWDSNPRSQQASSRRHALDRTATGIGPPGLTLKNSTWCSLCIQCFVRISEQTATFALYIINRLVFIAMVESVYSVVRTESLSKADYASSLKG